MQSYGSVSQVSVTVPPETLAMVFAPARAMFSALVDYAGLFPPAALDVPKAREEYAAARAGAHAWMLGRFIVPAAKTSEIPEEFSLSVIADRAPKTLAPLANVAAVEITLAAPQDGETYASLIEQWASTFSVANLNHWKIFVEIPRVEGFAQALPDALIALKRHGIGAKLRCGGVTPDAYPSPGEIAAFLFEVSKQRVPFKATAGLHHPVRALDPKGTNVVMHGFLNLLTGTLLARDGANTATIEAAIGEEDRSAFHVDGAAFRWRDHFYDAAAIAMMRREGFTAYGSCSFSEPVEDLTAMGMLER